MNEDNKFIKQVYDYWKESPESREETIRYLLSTNKFENFSDWKNIIVILFNIDSYFLEKQADRIIELIHMAQDEYGKSEVSTFLINYLSKESRLDLNFFNFFYALNQQYKKKNEEARKTFSKEELNNICYSRLERFVTGEVRNIEAAFNHFYSCWDYVDDKNKIHITPRALDLMRKYIDKLPEQYLKYSIRSYYTRIEPHFDYYHFVLEPFTNQIFNGWDNFEIFLNDLKDNKKIDQKVIECFLKFYSIYKQRKYDIVPIKKGELKDFKFCSNQIEEFLNKN